MGIQRTDVAGKLDHCTLHPQTDSKIGNLVDAGITDALKHPFDTPGTKPTRYQDTIHILEFAFPIFTNQAFRFNPPQVHSHAVRKSTV